MMNDLERRMEEKFTAKVEHVEQSLRADEEAQCRELELLRAEVKEAKELSGGITDGVRHVEDRLLETLGNQHRALKADFAETLQDIFRLQEKNRRADMASVEPLLESQLKRILGEHHQTLETHVVESVDHVVKTQKKHGKLLSELEPALTSHLTRHMEATKHTVAEPNTQIREIHKVIHDDTSHLFDEIGRIQKR